MQLFTSRLPYENRPNNWAVIKDVMQGVTPLRPDDTLKYNSLALVDLLTDCWALAPHSRPEVDEVESRLGKISGN
jgi:hypothetical protein